MEDEFDRIKRERRFAFEQKREEIFRRWETETPVYIATSSNKRKDGIIAQGFVPENIHLMPMPDELEIETLEDYLEKFTPNLADKHGSGAMEEVAKRKATFLGQQGVPADSLWFAFDTLPVYYRANPLLLNPNEAYTSSLWKAETEKKPENNEQMRAVAKRTFLSVMRNHIRFDENLKLQGKGGWVGLEKTASEDMITFYKKMDFASGIHVKTAFAVRFPNEENIEVHSDRIIVRPRRLYEIADELGLPQSPDDPNLFTAESLGAQIHPSGQTVNQILDELLDQIYAAMNAAGVDPMKISGGIAYHLESVQNILKGEEMPNIVTETGLDRTIYTGFPEKLFQVVLAQKVESLATRELAK
jgi:hypothetical protein